MSKSCGECTACCTSIGVYDLGKPQGVTCKHCIVRGGCGIYASRPEECANFACAWLVDPEERFLRDEDRPDRSGVVLTDYPDPDGDFRRLYGARGLQAFEAWPGALNSYKVEKILKRLQRVFIILKIPFGDYFTRDVIGPERVPQSTLAQVAALGRSNARSDGIRQLGQIGRDPAAYGIQIRGAATACDQQLVDILLTRAILAGIPAPTLKAMLQEHVAASSTEVRAFWDGDCNPCIGHDHVRQNG